MSEPQNVSHLVDDNGGEIVTHQTRKEGSECQGRDRHDYHPYENAWNGIKGSRAAQQVLKRKDDKRYPCDAKTYAERHKVSVYGIAKVSVGVPTSVQIDTNLAFIVSGREPSCKRDPRTFTYGVGTYHDVCTGCVACLVHDRFRVVLPRVERVSNHGIDVPA